jgi:NDP-sugar pyrophosphorylase family protein
MKPTLVVLAAGIGNRYGGLKQVDAFGPSGETIIDYSVFDAVRAGFGRVVFVIRRSIEKDFREAFLSRLEGRIDVRLAFQELGDVPAGHVVPEGRTKPWGTTHAVLAAASEVGEPFAAINADDFYGRGAYAAMAGFLGGLGNNETIYSLVGYRLDRTLSEHGSVARGVCEVGPDNRLTGIVERLNVVRTGGRIRSVGEDGRETALAPETIVSMNFWGFTPAFFGQARSEFEAFLKSCPDPLKSEIYIPLVVNNLIRGGRAEVRVLESTDAWFGVTYREDKPRVMAEIRALVEAGVYPNKLWA